MNRKQKKTLYRIVAAAALLVGAALAGPYVPGPRILVFLIPYFTIGWDILWKALRNIKNGQVFDENFLMAIATVGALVIGEYPEAVFVMLFYQVGELFQAVAVGRSRRSIAALMDIRPDYANVERNGEVEKVDPEEVAVGEIILIRPGERVPIDAVVLEGSSTLNTAALTGESLPRDVGPGENASTFRGCCGYRPSRSLGNPPWPRSWSWWRTPPRKRRKRNSLSPGLPGGTPRRWWWERYCWRCCPPC